MSEPSTARPRTAAGRDYLAWDMDPGDETAAAMEARLGRHWTTEDAILAIETEAARPLLRAAMAYMDKFLPRDRRYREVRRLLTQADHAHEWVPWGQFAQMCRICGTSDDVLASDADSR